MFRRKKTKDKTDEPPSMRKWSLKKKKLDKSASSTSINSEVPHLNHQRSATEPPKIDLSQKVVSAQVNSSVEAVKKSFQRHFPRLYFTGEVVIKSFTCAIEKDIIMQGKMFLTPRYACFYSNVFNRNYCLEIPYLDVTKIEKRNTVGVIPNAISICIADDVHFFLSFTKRDLAYDLLNEFWENEKMNDNDINNISLEESFDTLSRAGTMLAPDISLQGSSFDDDIQEADPFREKISSGAVRVCVSPSNGEVDMNEDGSNKSGDFLTPGAYRRLTGRSSRGSLSFSHGINFGPIKPLNWEMLEIFLNIDFYQVFTQIFGDSQQTWNKIHKSCGTNGLFIGNWKKEDNLWSRNLIYSPSIKMPNSSSTTMFMEKQIVQKYQTYATMEASIRLQNSVNYASIMETPVRSRLLISAQIDYLKKNFHSKANIEASVLDWLILFHSSFLSHVKVKFPSDPESNQTPPPLKIDTALTESSADNSAQIPRNIKRRDYRFLLVLGIIISLLLGILVKFRRKVPDESLADQILEARNKLLEQEINIDALWEKYQKQKELGNQDQIIL